MTFLAMMIALVVALAWGSLDALQQDRWFEQWRSQVTTSSFPGIVKLALIVVLPALLLQLLLNVLESVLFGLVWIAAAAYLLLYSMGRGDYTAQLERYRKQCRRNDFEAAYLAAAAQSGWLERDMQEQPLAPKRIHTLVLQHILYDGYQRWFAVLFYFVWLGPAVAVAYRFLQLASEQDEGVARVLHFVDWLPSRLLAAAFALTGNFVESFDELLVSVRSASTPTSQVLNTVALAATGGDQVPLPDGELFAQYAARQVESYNALLRRSGVCWVVIISLAVLFL